MLNGKIGFFLAANLCFSTPGLAAHAVAQFGEPKYPANFEHFDYVDSNAPKTGTLNLSVISQGSSFDKYNPFTLKGKVAPGLLELVFETLTVNSLDEPNTQYGLLADDIQLAPDFSQARFHINPKAKFSNGDQDSYFAHSPLQAKVLPTEAEIQLLEPYRAQLDPAVFGSQVEQPKTRPPSSLRQNLSEAMKLFAEAGWHNTDGVLRNSKGEAFEIELTGASGSLLGAYYYNLAKLGIVLKQRPVDASADRVKMKNFNYDFAAIAFREARNPAAELWRNLNSADADKLGYENIIGVKSTVVDDLIKKLYEVNTQQEQETVAHALDRVLMHGYYVLPWRYLSHHYLIHHKRLQRPKTLPLYYGAYEWVINTWWDGADNQ